MSSPNPGFTHPDANCRGVDPELFFPEHASNGKDVDRAINICRACPDPCREACLEHAITWREAGIWGATTGRQRRTMRTRRTRDIPPDLRHRPGCADHCIAELNASDGKWISTRELVNRTGYSAASINTTLRDLADRGAVERAQGTAGRPAYWRVPKIADVEVTA
jgi:WhiB family redox-sensing transcriptional regulator